MIRRLCSHPTRQRFTSLSESDIFQPVADGDILAADGIFDFHPHHRAGGRAALSRRSPSSTDRAGTGMSRAFKGPDLRILVLVIVHSSGWRKMDSTAAAVALRLGVIRSVSSLRGLPIRSQIASHLAPG